MRNQTHHNPQSLLMQALNFTPDDLEANRSLRLSQRQMHMVQTMSTIGSSCIGSFMAIAAVPFILIASFIVLQATSTQVALIFLVFVTGIAGLAITAYKKRPSRAFLAIYENAPIQSLRGVASRTMRKNPREFNTNTCFVVIGDHPFQVKEYQLRQFQEGQMYQVYYIQARFSSMILSVEIVNDANQLPW